jgi:hypothetical protein
MALSNSTVLITKIIWSIWMNKFIDCKNGDFVNLSFIHTFSVDCDNEVIANTQVNQRILKDGFNSREEAQEWLDKLMKKHGLCI